MLVFCAKRFQLGVDACRSNWEKSRWRGGALISVFSAPLREKTFFAPWRLSVINSLGRPRLVGLAEQPGAGMGFVLALVHLVMNAGDDRALDPAGGAHPLRIGDDRDAIDRADQADEQGEVLQLLDDRGERDRGRAADIGEDVELRGGVEDGFEPVERGRDVGGGEMALRDDGDGAGGEGVKESMGLTMGNSICR